MLRPKVDDKSPDKRSTRNGRDREKKKELSLAWGSEKLLNRVLKREFRTATVGDSPRMGCRMPASVPFQWEVEPGKPKDLEEANIEGTKECKVVGLFPLTPPPGRRSFLATELRRTQSNSASIPQSPRSVTGKMKNILNGKFHDSQNLDGDDNTVDTVNIISQYDFHLINVGKNEERTSERLQTVQTNGTSDFGLQRSSSKKASSVRGIRRLSRVTGSLDVRKSPSDECKSSNDQESSPRSTLDYASTRSSPSSSPYSFPYLSSFSCASPSTRPSTSPGSDGRMRSNVPHPTAAPAILANCLISIANQIGSEPQGPSCHQLAATKYEILTSRKDFGSCSGPQPSAIKSGNSMPHTFRSQQSKVFSDPQKWTQLESQKNAWTESDLSIRYPTPNGQNHLSPQGTVSCISTSQQLHNNSHEPSGRLSSNRSSSERTLKLKRSNSCKDKFYPGNLRQMHVRKASEISDHAQIGDPGHPNVPNFLRRLTQAEEELSTQRNDCTASSSCMAIWRRTKLFGKKAGW